MVQQSKQAKCKIS